MGSSIQSTIGHVESDGNMGGPPSKPKYYLMTDSGAVLGRKGEKNPGRGVKENLKPYVYKHLKHDTCDEVLFVERSGELLYAARLSNSVTEPQGNRV